MALFVDASFPSSITLVAAEWTVVVEALVAAEEFDLANKIANAIGTKPE